MIAPDANILLYAFREDSPRHNEYRSWLAEVLIGEEPVALFEPVLAAVLRIATHPAIYRTPAPREAVEKYIAALRAAPAAVLLRAGERHWNLFVDFCRKADCHGNMVQDAYLAALALEHGCAWITSDRDFARFPQLVWRHPLDRRGG